MKTNHQRGFVGNTKFRKPFFYTATQKGQEGIYQSKSIGNDFCNGHKGAQKAKAGAKRYVRGCVRREGKLLVKEELQ